MSLDKSPGHGDQHPDKAPGPERRPFPGAPEDRPVPSKPTGYRSFEEIAADRAARAAGKAPGEGTSGQAGHGAGRDTAGPGKGPVGAGSGTADAGPRGSAAAPGSRERTGAVPGNAPARGEDTRPVPPAFRGQDTGRPDIPVGRRPDRFGETDRSRHRPFPGAPEDRPVPSKPVAYRSFEEIRAERAARAGGKGLADLGPAKSAERPDSGQPVAKDAGRSGKEVPAEKSGSRSDAERDAGPREQNRVSRDQAGQGAPKDRENNASADKTNAAQSAGPDPGSDRHPGSTAQTDKTLPAGHEGPGATGGPRPPDGGDPPVPGTPGHGKGGILHGHSEFHGQKLDLYSDGTRWVSGDAVRAAQAEAAKKQADGQSVPAHHGITDIPGMREQGANVVGDKPPDDETELPPDRMVLLEADDRKKSLRDRLLDRLEDEEVLDDLQDKGAQHADTLQQLFGARPPAMSLQVHNDSPYLSPAPQHATAGDIFSAVLLTSVALAESGRRMHDMLSRRREER